LITIIRLIRVTLKYIEEKTKAVDTNPVGNVYLHVRNVV